MESATSGWPSKGNHFTVRSVDFAVLEDRKIINIAPSVLCVFMFPFTIPTTA